MSNTNEIWCFHPMEGIEITNKQHDLENPIFGDATIVSAKNIDNLIPSWINENQNKEDRQSGSFKKLEIDLGSQDCYSYLAVRRTGKFPECGQGFLRRKIVRDSRKRAYQITALLSLIFLTQNQYGRTCTLIEQMVERRRTSCFMFDSQTDNFALGTNQSGLHSLLDSDDRIKIKRKELLDLVYKDPYKEVTKIILSQNHELPNSLREPIMESTLRLSDAVHTADYSNQILGAITSIEILLSYGSSNFTKIEKRLTALLGKNEIEKYNAKKILSMRHKYVHSGEKQKDYSRSLKAIGLALSCILSYAKVIKKFDSTKDFIDYLDFVYKADDLLENWNEQKKEKLISLLKHEREGYKFDFIYN